MVASASKARHLYGLVFPRERRFTAAGARFANAWFRLRGSAFRTYLHPTEKVDVTQKYDRTFPDGTRIRIQGRSRWAFGIFHAMREAEVWTVELPAK